MSDQLFEGLDRVFHEPKRLGIVSSLCAAKGGLSFVQLKNILQMTDGNLSRHLSLLEEQGMVIVRKEFVGAKPRSTVLLTAKGNDEFRAYLSVLEEVLRSAQQGMAPESEASLDDALPQPSA